MYTTEKLEQLVQKLKMNREKVPHKILETKYKQAYESLKYEIKTETEKIMHDTLLFGIEELGIKEVKKEYAQDIENICLRVYKNGDYAARIRKALYRDYSVEEFKHIVDDGSRKLTDEIYKYFHTKTCLYCTRDCFNNQDPKTPRIYNDLTGRFWDDEAGGWIREDLPDEKAILIFISDSKMEVKKQ